MYVCLCASSVFCVRVCACDVRAYGIVCMMCAHVLCARVGCGVYMWCFCIICVRGCNGCACGMCAYG